MFQALFKCDSRTMESDWNHNPFRRHVCWVMSRLSVCLRALLPSLWPIPRSSQPQSHWFPSLLECEWFAVLDLLSGSNRSVSHMSHCAAMNPSGIGFPQSWTLSFITSAQKVPAGRRFYMRGIVLFLLAEQLLLTAFSLQTCLTRLPRQTVDQLNCNQSNFIYMTSSGSPQQIPPHLPLSLASHVHQTPAGLIVQSSILGWHKRREIKSALTDSFCVTKYTGNIL